MIKPRIIVTGATGKTGSVVVAELLRAGYTVEKMADAQFAPTPRSGGADTPSSLAWKIRARQRPFRRHQPR